MRLSRFGSLCCRVEGLHCAHAHMARTVVRRAERTFWRCASDELKESGIGSYLNRVSDYLFVLARTVC